MRLHRPAGFRLLVAASLLGLWVPSAIACVNLASTDRNGRAMVVHDLHGENLVHYLRGASNPDDRVRITRRAIEHVKARNDFVSRNDLGVALLRHGRTTEAIRLFLLNERLQPGRYETATNLGTALELAGQDATALRWIRIGIRRNPRAHAGTEWLHARILEAKIAAFQAPALLRQISIAGVDFGTDGLPALPRNLPAGNNGEPVTAVELNSAFQRQLFERMSFVPPEDPVVANLLTDWATLNLAGGPLETAVALYEEAIRYGAVPTPRIEAWHSRAKRIVEASTDRPLPGRGRCPICASPAH